MTIISTTSNQGVSDAPNSAFKRYILSIPEHSRVLKCAACGKTLRPRTPGGVDSSHIGLGPSCNKKYTAERCQPGTALHRMVMRLAFLQRFNKQESGMHLALLRKAGFEALVRRIAKRCSIKVAEDTSARPAPALPAPAHQAAPQTMRSPISHEVEPPTQRWERPASSRNDRRVVISYEANGRIRLDAPFLRETVEPLRGIPGRQYEGGSVNSFPGQARKAVVTLLRKFYRGYTLVGPKGNVTL